MVVMAVTEGQGAKVVQVVQAVMGAMEGLALRVHVRKVGAGMVGMAAPAVSAGMEVKAALVAEAVMEAMARQ
ncbi:MAG: hypothetical protein DMF64_09895 [Acidobacteria bacterium]|nr:MAG: hypothetical protein DMF64_09895 [Acidobacteriota bacterium]